MWPLAYVLFSRIFVRRVLVVLHSGVVSDYTRSVQGESAVHKKSSYFAFFRKSSDILLLKAIGRSLELSSDILGYSFGATCETLRYLVRSLLRRFG
jgi:hypothetical protein